jgi:hypothetical protein
MPQDERTRGLNNRQIDVHVRDLDPAARSGRIGARGLAIAAGILALGLIALVFALLR